MAKIKSFFQNHKKLSIVLIVILVLLIAKSVFAIFNKKDYIEVSQSQVATLNHKDVVNSVNETGTVVSSNSVDVYAENQLPIDTIDVKVGDKVNEGDIIGTLVSTDIEQQIAAKEEANSAQRSSVSAQVSAAKNRLSEAIKGKESGTHSALQGANNNITVAFDQYKQAKKTYEDYKRSIDEGYNPELIAEKAERENLSYLEKSGMKKYDQLNESIHEDQRDINDNREKERSLDRDVSRTEARIDDLNDELTEIGIEIVDLNNKIADITSQMMDKPTSVPKGNGDGSSNNTNTNVVANSSNANKNLKDMQDKIKELREQINDKTREQSDIQNEIKNLSSDLASYQADREKYRSEAEALEKAIPEKEKQLDAMKLDVEKAQDDLRSGADKELKNTETRTDQLKTLKQSMDAAKDNYDEALKALDSAKAGVDNEIKTLQDGVKQAETGYSGISNKELQFLKESLDRTIMKAPISGTITKTYAEEGQMPTGPVATIETVDTLRVESHIKEYNINDVKVGTKVVLTSDAIEGVELTGKVISIDPAPEKNENVQSKDVYYKTTIEIDDEHKDKLAPGMSLRVKYILSEEKDTYSVPTGAIFERDNKNYVLSLVDAGSEKYKITLTEVTPGLSNDFETSIKGKKLKKGMKVLTSSSGYGEGQLVKIIESPKAAEGNEQNG
ncbi:HlyD family efflux transporter periplasmic adaptor subunit [Peptoniphilus sp.]|jgi:HlyD family secretion protein|uniref:HlyD family secretion protein n=1 Tax=Peptoniphilus sp. TaxID=1971214 RepID=UPI003D8E9F9F